jgi:hypothetical protein
MKKILFSVFLILFVAITASSQDKTCQTCQDEATNCAVKCKAVHHWGWGSSACREDCRKEFKSCTKDLKTVCELPKILL